jgi:hypothetical protein
MRTKVPGVKPPSHMPLATLYRLLRRLHLQQRRRQRTAVSPAVLGPSIPQPLRLGPCPELR